MGDQAENRGFFFFSHKTRLLFLSSITSLPVKTGSFLSESEEGGGIRVSRGGVEATKWGVADMSQIFFSVTTPTDARPQVASFPSGQSSVFPRKWNENLVSVLLLWLRVEVSFLPFAPLALALPRSFSSSFLPHNGERRKTPTRRAKWEGGNEGGWDHPGQNASYMEHVTGQGGIS